MISITNSSNSVVGLWEALGGSARYMRFLIPNTYVWYGFEARDYC